jgi:hypothetical protein
MFSEHVCLCLQICVVLVQYLFMISLNENYHSDFLEKLL